MYLQCSLRWDSHDTSSKVKVSIYLFDVLDISYLIDLAALIEPIYLFNQIDRSGFHHLTCRIYISGEATGTSDRTNIREYRVSADLWSKYIFRNVRTPTAHAAWRIYMRMILSNTILGKQNTGSRIGREISELLLRRYEEQAFRFDHEGKN